MVMMCISLLFLIEWHSWFGDATWPVARISWSLMAVVSGLALLRGVNSERLKRRMNLKESVRHPFDRHVDKRLNWTKRSRPLRRKTS
jgi:hypothetical protein